MIRRNARLRKEYLYRKGLEGKERVAYEHKRKVREALEGTFQRIRLAAASCATVTYRNAVLHITVVRILS